MKTLEIKGNVRVKDHGAIHDGFELNFIECVRQYGRNSVWLDNSTAVHDAMPGNVVGMKYVIIDPQKPIFVSLYASNGAGEFEIRGPMVARAKPSAAKCWIRNSTAYADGNNVTVWIGGMGVDWSTGT
jgi:hypothetical protein